MSFDLDDTIAAIASPPGAAPRGIVRVSGPRALACLARIVQIPGGGSLDAIKAAARLPATISLSEALGDVPLILYVWPTSRSYTRQPSAELHLPGSPPLLEAALEAICKVGARLARAGEFTLRALLAGRLDLTQAEAVLGVIDAQSQTELDRALAQLAGGLARPLRDLREQLLELLAHLEAGLDFVDQDIHFIKPQDLDRQLAAAAEQVAGLLAQMQARGEAGRLPRVALIGLPNTGKSSLLNALVKDDAALVSDAPGTTRDFISRRWSCGSRQCLLIDTAGLQEEQSGPALEAAAQQVAQQQALQADLTLLCLDASRPLKEWEREQLIPPRQVPRLVIWTKCDLPLIADLAAAPGAVKTSSRMNRGLDELRSAVGHQFDAEAGEAGAVASTSDRCRESLRLAGEALQRGRAALSAAAGDELIAGEVRIALDELGRVVGAVFTDDVLDRVFSRFCIGK
jgi:tRNA modification GTPase